MDKSGLYLKSRVAKRIVLLFVFCALIPVLILGALSFKQVVDHLHEESVRRLYQDGKALGMSTIERLKFLEAELKMLPTRIPTPPSAPLPYENSSKNGTDKFTSFFSVDDFTVLSAEARAAVGGSLSEKQKEHLASGRPVLIVRAGSESNRYYMAAARTPEKLSRGGVIAEINPSYLWGHAVADMLPPFTELFVMGHNGRVLYNSLPVEKAFLSALGNLNNRDHPAVFEWESEHDDYVAAGWTVFLDYMFAAPPWTVVMSMSTTQIYRPIENFKTIFPLTLLLSLLAVLLLSLVQIRRSLIPLEKLKEAARNIGMKRFNSRVSIKSGDEFEELGETFNSMADNLQKLFNAMSTRSDIDHCILSSLDIDTIVQTVLQNSDKFFNCSFTGISVITAKTHNAMKTYSLGDMFGEMCCLEDRVLSAHESDRLLRKKAHFYNPQCQECPAGFGKLVGPDTRLLLIIPIRLHGSLGGLIALGYSDPDTDINDDVTQAMYLAEQMAVAFTNGNLIQDLDALSRGAIRALARTVDAKSPWTAGHSERVAEMAVEIAREMHFEDEEHEKLYRAALLHDIGKVGVPVGILDKQGRLSDAEYEIICRHPEIAARILEPIKAFSDITSIILQHHEYFDGNGYPRGLSGENIELSARILAVADVYDAMVSDRPYRPGKPVDRVLHIILAESGKQFDPRVVEVFLHIVERGEQASLYG